VRGLFFELAPEMAAAVAAGANDPGTNWRKRRDGESSDASQADNTRRLGRAYPPDVLEPMKSTFVAKDEIIDLLGVCLVAGENLFLLGRRHRQDGPGAGIRPAHRRRMLTDLLTVFTSQRVVRAVRHP